MESRLRPSRIALTIITMLMVIAPSAHASIDGLNLNLNIDVPYEKTVVGIYKELFPLSSSSLNGDYRTTVAADQISTVDTSTEQAIDDLALNPEQMSASPEAANIALQGIKKVSTTIAHRNRLPALAGMPAKESSSPYETQLSGSVVAPVGESNSRISSGQLPISATNLLAALGLMGFVALRRAKRFQ